MGKFGVIQRDVTNLRSIAEGTDDDNKEQGDVELKIVTSARFTNQHTYKHTLRKISKMFCPAPVEMKRNASVEGLDVAEDTSYECFRGHTKISMGVLTKKKAR